MTRDRSTSLRVPPRPPESAPRGAFALRFALVAAGYVLAGLASMLIASGPGTGRLIWLPSGLALAALLVWGLRLWPAVFLGGAALGLGSGMTAGAALLLGAAGTLEALAGAAALNRFGFDPRCARLRDALSLSAAAFGAALLGGAIEFGAMLPTMAEADRSLLPWVCWLGRALGALIVVPLAAGWLGPERGLPGGWRLPELALLAAATGGLSAAVFAAMGDPHMFNPLPYALFPLLFWGALRFGPREVAGLLLLAALLAAWGTASGHGPFALAGREAGLASLYLYLSIAGVAALALAASIEERARVGEALAASEAQYRELVETMNEGVVALDAQGRVRFASGPFARMAEAAPEALAGRPVAALFGDGARAWPVSPDPAHRAPSSFEAELARADGSRLQVSVSPRAIRDEANRVGGWLAVVADISERRRTDDMLRWIARATAPLTGEAFFRELMRHMAAAFGFKYAFITECVDYPVTRVRMLACWDGAGFAQNLEYELPGTPCEETVRGRRVCCIRDEVEARFPAERGMGVRGYLGVPIMDSAGEHIIGHVAFLSEGQMDEAVLASPLFQILTSRAGAELRRKRAEEQGRQHLQQLAQVSRALALGEMGSAIAHELNQPLAAVAAYAQASRRLIDSGESTEEIRHALERIGAQAERAGEILRRLRGFLAGGETAIAPLDPGPLIAEIVDLAQPEARQRGVALSVEQAPGLPWVRADGIQVQQVILNLVRNAIEATAGREGGERRVRVQAIEEEDGVSIAVSDSGPGVPPELEARVFEPFFTTRADGTGIGLAISRSIAQAHGGRLRLERPPEGGARFVFWLPREGRNDA